MPVDVSATLAGLDALTARINEASETIAGRAALIVQRAGMAATHVRTGTLRRSWTVVGPEGSGGAYSAQVGPTMVYARRQELGFQPPLRDSLGRSFPNDYGRPYVQPSALAARSGIEQMAISVVTEAVS